jgi:hypothetical protein
MCDNPECTDCPFKTQKVKTKRHGHVEVYCPECGHEVESGVCTYCGYAMTEEDVLLTDD